MMVVVGEIKENSVLIQCFDTVTPKYTISEKALVEGRGILLDNTLS